MPWKPTMPVADRFWSKVRKTDSCWLWTANILQSGYGMFALTKTQMRRAHRYAWELTKGPIPPGLFVCHACDVKACVNPAHLFLGTAKDNTQDASRKGRLAIGDAHWTRQHPERVTRGADHPTRRDPALVMRGARHGNAVLTETMVRDIRARHATGEQQLAIARSLSISAGAVAHVVHRRSWQHVE